MATWLFYNLHDKTTYCINDNFFIFNFCILQYESYVIQGMQELLKIYNPSTPEGDGAAAVWDFTMAVR